MNLAQAAVTSAQDLHKMLTDKDEEMERLRNQFTDKDEEMERLRNQLTDKDEEMERLRNQLKDKDEEMERLRTQLKTEATNVKQLLAEGKKPARSTRPHRRHSYWMEYDAEDSDADGEETASVVGLKRKQRPAHASMGPRVLESCLGSEGIAEDEEDTESDDSVVVRPPAHKKSDGLVVKAVSAHVDLADLLHDKIPHSYRTTIEDCLRVVFEHPSLAGTTHNTLDALKAAVRALPQETRDNFLWERAIPSHKQCMQRILAYLMDDSVVLASSSSSSSLVEVSVEQQLFDKVRSCGGMKPYRRVFDKVLADGVLPPSSLESLDAFTAHMRKDETQTHLLDYYNTKCDNQKKGVVAALFTTAGVDASFLKATNRAKAKSVPPVTPPPPPLSSSSISSMEDSEEEGNVDTFKH